MKKRETIRDLLGFTQEEMALLLKVGCSRWSMYELGKGNLPSSATLLLNEMLLLAMSSKLERKSHPEIQKQQAKAQKKFEYALKENEYQQLFTARKITVLEKKCASKMQVLPLADFLSAEASEKGETDKAGFLKAIANNASRSLEKEGWVKLKLLKLKKTVLEFEQQVLEAELERNQA